MIRSDSNKMESPAQRLTIIAFRSIGRSKPANLGHEPLSYSVPGSKDLQRLRDNSVIVQDMLSVLRFGPLGGFAGGGSVDAHPETKGTREESGGEGKNWADEAFRSKARSDQALSTLTRTVETHPEQR